MSSKNVDVIYHYTVGSKLEQISDTGALLPKGFGLAANEREKPVLWFSANPSWETTANKVMSKDGGVTFFRPQLRELQATVGVYRFRLDLRDKALLQRAGARVHPWTRLQTLARFDARAVNNMVTRALEFGATPTLWWGALDPIRLEFDGQALLQLEVRNIPGPGEAESWKPISLAEAIDQFNELGVSIAHMTTAQAPGARDL